MSGVGKPGVGTVVKIGAAGVNADRLRLSHVWVESPLRLDELDVYWRPIESSQDRYPSGYNVYRLISPQSGLSAPNAVKLNSTLINIPLYRDLTVETARKAHYYYVVTAQFSDGSETPLAEPVTLHTHLNPPGRRKAIISLPRVYAEFRRRKHIMLDNNGELAELLIKRRSGVRCQCMSCAFEASTDSNCELCYGTGFDRGYELLKEVVFRYVPVIESLQLKPQGIMLKSNPKGWLVDFPLLRDGDILVRRNGERYEISNVMFMTHQGILTHQDFDLLTIPATSAVINYDVNAGQPVV